MPRQDPLRNFRFRVEVDDIAAAAFSAVQIGATSTDVIDYREGTDPPHVRKLSGRTKYDVITLERGVTQSLEFYQWYQEIVAGQISRRQVSIIVQDDSGADKARFVVRQAWPVKYKVSPLCGTGSEVFIELIELTNEGIERVA